MWVLKDRRNQGGGHRQEQGWARFRGRHSRGGWQGSVEEGLAVPCTGSSLCPGAGGLGSWRRMGQEPQREARLSFQYPGPGLRKAPPFGGLYGLAGSPSWHPGGSALGLWTKLI